MRRNQIQFLKWGLIALVIASTAFVVLGHRRGLARNYQAASATGPWSFSDDAKDLNLIYLGYSRCPDLCPMTLSLMKSVFSKLSAEELARVRFLFLDLDIENDNASVAGKYVSQFNPGFVGLSGSKSQIDEIVSAMGARYNIEIDQHSRASYAISHTNRIFFLNKEGQIVNSLGNPDSAESILKMLKDSL